MSLIRQVWLLVWGVILLATAGSMVVSVATARTYLESQLALKNNDNAQALALTLSQSGADPSLAQLVMAAQFDTGSYRIIRLRREDGTILFERTSSVGPIDAPDWFVRWVPIQSRTGVAQVTRGWNSIGVLEVESLPVFAYQDLWRGTVSTAAWMLMLGVLAAAISAVAVRRLSRPLEALVRQADALTQRRFVTVELPSTPELKQVAIAMNGMVDRVRKQFAEQADQLEGLRRQAHLDPLTGLLHRDQFLHQCETDLSRERGLGAGRLLMVRVLRLAEVNRQVGHARTDELLVELAKALLRGVGAVQPRAIGRLNGSDFALLLDHTEVESEALAETIGRLRDQLLPFGDMAVVLAETAWRRGESVRDVLARVDAALARAEHRGDFSIETARVEQDADGLGGEMSWRRGILEALSQQRVTLTDYPLVDSGGRLIHFECPLRLKLSEAGPYLPAAVWLPLALRTGVISEVDEVAVRLGLEAILKDGVRRSINVSARSLQVLGFLPRLRALLALHPLQARLLAIEIDEAGLHRDPSAVAELCRQLRPCGVQVGLEHAGQHLAAMGELLETGLDFVKLRVGATQEWRGNDAQAALLRGTVGMLKGLGVQAYAEGVAHSQDLEYLWSIGLDGLSGPAAQVQTAG